MSKCNEMKIIVFLIAASNVCLTQTIPDKAKRDHDVMSKSSGSPSYALFNVNNFTNWVRYDGPGHGAPSGDNQSYFPRGIGNVIYKDGIYWAAKVFTDANHFIPASQYPIRVGGKGYNSGLQAGWVTGFGSSATRILPSDPNVHIYRIRRDYKSMSDAEARTDAAGVNETDFSSATDAQIALVRAQYDTDWKNWPVNLGAPYIERNGILGYQAPPPFTNYPDPGNITFTVESLIIQKRDEPGIAGSDPSIPADQVLWTVANDLDSVQTVAFQKSKPLGLEIQFTIWGYKGYDQTGNMFFKRIKIINKGGVDTSSAPTPNNGSFWLDSMFVGIWSDPDVGNSSDDLIGCDTTLQLGYAYNGNFEDATFKIFGLPPPSVGYVLLQGPVVNGSPGDSAVKDFHRIFGKKNLPLTSFVYEGPGYPYSEPITIPAWWNWLRGYAPLVAETFYVHGPFPETRFPFSGDPVSRTGFIDGLGTVYSWAPGDPRLMLNSGPFALAPGDTQEILVSVVGALGSDRLSSISLMKLGARLSRRFQRTFFNAPRAPTAPVVEAAQLDRQIILTWGSDIGKIVQTEEGLIAGDYVFEGYNVYQLPSSTSRLSEGKKIATYDIRNGVTEVVDLEQDPATGALLPRLIQRGTDSGIQRFLEVRKDYIKNPDIPPQLNNGERYYFAVTAYNYSSLFEAVPKSFESQPVVLSVAPKIPFGINPPSKYGEVLPSVHQQGSSNGFVSPMVLNPLSGTGDSYDVQFDTAAGRTTWSVRNSTRNRILVIGQTNQSGDQNYPIIEGGVLVKVVNATSGQQNSVSDIFTFTIPAVEAGPAVQKQSAQRVGVFPNPYYGSRDQETTTWRRFVTFNNLPPRAKIYIFNLAGHLVRTLEKNDPSQFLEWDLTNTNNWQVASGIYICYVEMPEIGETKILKLSVIQSELPAR